MGYRCWLIGLVLGVVAGVLAIPGGVGAKSGGPTLELERSSGACDSTISIHATGLDVGQQIYLFAASSAGNSAPVLLRSTHPPTPHGTSRSQRAPVSSATNSPTPTCGYNFPPASAMPASPLASSPRMTSLAPPRTPSRAALRSPSLQTTATAPGQSHWRAAGSRLIRRSNSRSGRSSACPAAGAAGSSSSLLQLQTTES